MIRFIWKLLLKIKNPSCKINTSLVGRNVNLSKGIHIGFGSVVAADVIGKHTFINDYCLIDKNVKTIGSYCSIAYNTRLGLGGHPKDWVTTHPFAYNKKYNFRTDSIEFDQNKNWDTIIGNDVWIGTNVTVLAGVTIGDGAIIGAHSLVTKDVKPYSIVLGSPARHVKYRFEESITDQLKELKWWDWSEEKIKANISLFNSPEKLLESLNKK